jgi:2-keto-4-pentenoate hydratase/2-oxohepta-3-ene-1,7-dioic acid hydratase in catechol pathway
VWAERLFSNWQGFLLSGDRGLDLARRLIEFPPIEPQDVGRVKMLAPFHAGSKILAHVVNYWEHGEEANLNPPELPFFFYKQTSSVINPDEPIIAHTSSAKMDHEVELAVVIGAVCRNATEENARQFIAGYTILNDVSYRDYQMIEAHPSVAKRYGKNWTQGKGLDHACPIGPWMVTADDLGEPYPLNIECKVNGEIRQKSDTGRMIHKISRQLAEITRGLTLFPGDIVSTGTCEGGGVGTGLWLRPGDIVECLVERIGVLRNEVALPSY